jgi:chemotaxis protein MotB
MARKAKHEEHANHEAWAIPYGDLVTLMFALFVVMYAVSSVNEGKFRVLSESMAEAFGGPPRSVMPIQIGEKITHGEDHAQKMSVLPSPVLPQRMAGVMRDLRNPSVIDGHVKSQIAQHESVSVGDVKAKENLRRMADEVRKSLGELISKGMIQVRPSSLFLEIEIKTDILFGSGQASVSDNALPVLMQLAGILKPYPNAIRIEGHTDDVPISTAAFPSNWELSAARAASVVHLFMERGVDPKRMSVEGWGEYQPVADNTIATGRNQNRRVLLVVLAANNAREIQTLLEDHQEAISSGVEPTAEPAPSAMPPEVSGASAAAEVRHE